MDKKEILKEAKLTIENIKKAQDTLDSYTKRLEKIISKLEEESLKKEKLTKDDVNKINYQLTKNEKVVKESSIQPKTKADDSEIMSKSKNKKIVFSILISFASVFLFLSLFLSIKAFKPDIKIFNHYIYSYRENNMPENIPYNSLVIFEKVKNKPIKVNDKVFYKQINDSIKSKEVKEIIKDQYLIKSEESVFDDSELLYKNEIMGRLKFQVNKLGGIMQALISNIWLVYTITVLLFITSLVISKKD